MRKCLAIVLVVAMAGLAGAETMRPLLTKENRFPEQAQIEVGALFQYIEYEETQPGVEIVGATLLIQQASEREEMSATPYVRVGLLDNLAVYGTLPYRDISDDAIGAEDHNGIGDVTIGFEARVYEDIFDYPYVIPHLEVSFDTGDEDEGLGAGESTVAVGCSVGTVVLDIYHWIVDASYEICDDRDNIASGALSFIWDISDEFSVLAEAGVTDEEIGPSKDHPSYYQAGMCYQPTDELVINVYGGGSENTGQDMVAMVKTAYTF